MRSKLASGLVFLGLGIVGQAAAENAPSVAGSHSVVQAARPSPEWYGWQTGGADLVALGVFSASAAADPKKDRVGDALVVLGAGTFAFGAPLVHLAHGRPWTAAGSLGLRLGLPFLFGGVAGGCMARKDVGCEGEAVGVLVGVVLAHVVDTWVLSWKPPSPKTQEVSLSPVVTVARERFSVGLGGAF